MLQGDPNMVTVWSKKVPGEVELFYPEEAKALKASNICLHQPNGARLLKTIQ